MLTCMKPSIFPGSSRGRAFPQLLDGSIGRAAEGWAQGRTHSVDEHGEAAEGGDGVREVRLGKVQLADVAADLLHHDLAGLRLAPDLPDLPKQLLDGRLGRCQILPASQWSQLRVTLEQTLPSAIS